MKKMNLFHPHPDIPVNPDTDLSNGTPHNIKWGESVGNAILIAGPDVMQHVRFRCHRLVLREFLGGNPSAVNYIYPPAMFRQAGPGDGLFLLRGHNNSNLSTFNLRVISESSHYVGSVGITEPCLVLKYLYSQQEVVTLSAEDMQIVEQWFSNGGTTAVSMADYESDIETADYVPRDDYDPDLDLEIAQTIVGLKNFFEIP